MGQKGQVELFILLIIILVFSYAIVGGLYPKAAAPQQDPNMIPISNTSCCEKADCSPVAGESITVQLPTGPQDYGLLKLNIKLIEGGTHLEDTGQTANGKPIIRNASDQWDDYPRIRCGGPDDDLLWKPPYTLYDCSPIPNDQLMYVCAGNCQPNDLTDPYCLYQNRPDINPPPPCYGNPDSVFDVYIRLSDLSTSPLPDSFRNCQIGDPNISDTGIEIIDPPTTPQPNLQLKDIQIRRIPLSAGSSPWVSPYCKPAIYLYPGEKTEVNVKLATLGRLTLTIPEYPTDGWDVTAYPNGTIVDQLNSYDYLYYEAEIPDELIEKPQEGFLVEYDKLEKLFNTILPKLGLNEKESSQFKEYWLKALPEASYYFVGIVSTENLDSIAPLFINPKPESVIRLTLYFEALDGKKEVKTPDIQTAVRDGFTVVEWGGIVKPDPKYPFTCFQ